MKRISRVGAPLVLLALAGWAMERTHPSAAAASTPWAPAPDAPLLEGAAERLAGAIRFPTVSHASPDAFDAAAFAGLHAYLESMFPRVHRELRREAVATHSLLYTWPGSDPTLPAILLMGHMDVVPVEPGTEGAWQQDPFGGRIEQGFVWGRGAVDNKAAVVGMLEAVESLLAEGFRPARTLYLAFGHDEEVGGSRGAREIAARLRSRGVRLAVAVDEGGVIGEGILPGVASPLALIGVAEKGFLSLELTTRVAGGHSSLPPRESSIGILAAAIARLEEHPMPARLEGATRELFERIAPHLPPARRWVLANLWLTEPLVLRGLAGSPTTDAMVRTTTATTIFEAGTKDNVLPAAARAVVNFRILPGDSIADVVAHVRRVIDDPRVNVRPGGAFTAEPSRVSSSEAEGFRLLERTLRETAPDALVAPYLVVVVTDARHYADLAEEVYRFLPVRLRPGDLERMHGVDERIAIADYEAAVRTWRRLVRNGTAR